ncbi:lysozyme c-1-like [Centruroides vittatus]|uniref:lysozyme c-1-like n=1 Tax=Centruroides vittatus TaxID=120091 RepID=UPI003510214F
MTTPVVCFMISMILAMIAEGKVYKRCEMASILARNGIPRNQIPNWICLIRHESNFNSRATNRNRNGSKDYGIFQINDLYWCAPPGRNNECKIRCSKFLDNNIRDDIKCAKLIYKRHKFNAWYGWKNRCRGKNMRSYVRGCKY